MLTQVLLVVEDKARSSGGVELNFEVVDLVT